MDDQNIQTPVFKAGTLKKTCYSSTQELLDDFAANLFFTEDIVRTIEGAKGADGADGADAIAPPSTPSQSGSSYSESQVIIPIANGSTYVEITSGVNINNDKFKILSKREINPEAGSNGDDYPDFNSADGIVGVGCLVPDMQNNRTRIYFVFHPSSVTAVPNEHFVLVWTKAAD